MVKDFDWKGLAEALTYAHCEAQGIEVSANNPSRGTGREAGETRLTSCTPAFEVTRSSVSGNGGSPVKTPLEVVHMPINANSVAAESLPTAHVETCGPQGQLAESATGADYKGSAPEKFAGERAANEACSSQVVQQAMTSPAIQTLTAHCHRVSGKTLYERVVHHVISPLAVAILDAEMRAIYRNRPMEDE